MFNQSWNPRPLPTVAAAHRGNQEESPTVHSTSNMYHNNVDFSWAGQFPSNHNVPDQQGGHAAMGWHTQGILHHPIPYYPPHFSESAAGMTVTRGHQFQPAFNEAWDLDEGQDVTPAARAWEPTPSDRYDPLDHSQGSLNLSQLSETSASATSLNHDLPHPQADAPGISASAHHGLPQPHASTSGAMHLEPHLNIPNNLPQSHTPLMAMRLRWTESSGTTRSRTTRRSHRTGIERGEAARQLNSQSGTVTPTKTHSLNIVPFNDAWIVSQAKDNMKIVLLRSSLFPAKDEIAVKAEDAWTTTVENQPLEFKNLAKNSAVSGQKKLVNLVETMHNELREAGRYFVYFKYNLKEGNTSLATGNLEARADHVAELIMDESFLDTTLEVNGSLIIVPFGNTPVLEFIVYVVYDSKFQYEQYLSKDLPFTAAQLRPLFIMTGTIFRWALGERSNGMFVASDYVVDEW
ncbi:hypothetical protein DFJ58DRAFT_843941 [Suillus subalutaceus]|uniref:uncharacterized protein n=1 Tax=Suillus subalutaceus TaxID=48586 RepID=UPI001B8835E9|nr:uncharacterized protein DFJ58DRAFT_843941 [Suillus subalutaceus]KAG1844848.1 hypothetical protein DFJ58DRAFT_843941 [Suillus subalutaceus]